MKFYLFALFFALLFFSNKTSAQEVVWQVTKNDVTATLPSSPIDRNLTAKAVVSLRNAGRAAGNTVTFRINPKAEVTAVRVGANSTDFRKIADDKLGSLQRFSVSVPSVQPNEATTVSVEYRLKIDENSGLNAISPAGSQFLPLSVWVPTPNNPYGPRGGDFAPYSLNVIAPAGETVVSAGRASGANFAQNLSGQPFFITGSWDVIENASGISIYLPKGAGAEERKRAEDVAAFVGNARDFAASLFGVPADAPIRVVSVYRGAGFADGGTILVDPAIFRRQKLDAQTAMVLAESVAKIWMGNLIPLRAEGQGVLREGFSQFLATKFIEKQFGKETADIEKLRQRTVYAAIAQRDAPLALTTPLDDTYFASVSNKGAMIWRLVNENLGEERFWSAVKKYFQAKPDSLTLANFKQQFLDAQNPLVAQLFENGLNQPTDLDLLIGLPQLKGNQTVVALRNTGSFDAVVNVLAITETGERKTTKATVAAKNFGEASFNTTSKIVRVEVDPEKNYPQLDYSNDVAPRETTGNDLLAPIIQSFNRQDFGKAETNARNILRVFPNFDEARTWLARALLEQNKLDEAEKEFTASLNVKLPAAKTLAWSNIGLGEVFSRRNQNAQAVKYFDEAVKADVEYASNLAARNGRSKAETAANINKTIDEAAKTFFTTFDAAVISKQKAQLEGLIISGELTRFATGIVASQPESWQTRISRTELLNTNRMAVEVNLNAKVLSKDPQSGTALFILARTANGWKLGAVDLFEVR
ncbi:MAG: tetratricopeptide repeat protein [Acidobacteriota bacterium]|nr:tetratricopeptide repeat protein [Acidobacteriota bacterium]